MERVYTRARARPRGKSRVAPERTNKGRRGFGMIEKKRRMVALEVETSTQGAGSISVEKKPNEAVKGKKPFKEFNES